MDDAALMALSAKETAVFTQTLTPHWQPLSPPFSHFKIEPRHLFFELYLQESRSQLGFLRILVTLIGEAIYLIGPSAGVRSTTALPDVMTAS